MIETEKALLGIFIFDNSLIPADLDEDLFTYEPHGLMIREIKKLREQGKFFNLAILADKLWGRVSVPYMSTLLDYLGHRSPKFLAKDVNKYLKELSKEKLKKDLNELLKDPLCNHEDISHLISNSNFEDTEEDGSVEQGLNEYLDLVNNTDKNITIGFPSIDRVIGGLRYGEIFLVMGRTTTGKTWVLLNILSRLIFRVEDKIGFFSLEMPRSSITERMIQLNLDLSREEALEKANSKDELTNVFLESFKNVRIYSKMYSVQEIRLKIRSEGHKIIFIDFLGLLKGNTFDSQYRQTTQFISDLKKLAKEEDVLIIVAHQLSREAEDGSVPVRLHMARDSGAVEELSDFILGIWRPEISSDSEEAKNKIFLRLIKNRRGETWGIECHFNKKTGRIREIERRGEYI